MPAVLTFKVVLVGDGKVGKTWILNKWNNPSADFDDYYYPTLAPELTTKDVAVDGAIVRLQVWDMGFSDQEAASQFPRYVKGAAGAVLMYDMSDALSVDGVAHWHEQVRSLAGSGCAFVVSGCKADLPPAAGALQKARSFCESVRLEHVETSAQSGFGAARPFEALARELRRQAQGGVVGTPAQDWRSTLDDSMRPMEETMPVRPSAPVPSSAGQAGAGGHPGGGASGPARRVKLVLLGEPCVGKSSLAQRLVGDATPLLEDYVATAGPEIQTRRLPVNGAPTKLQVWDAPGQELMSDSKMLLPVMQGLDAAVIVYDVTARATFESVRNWMRLLEGHAGAETAVMLVGNKADVPRRAVTVEEGRRLAEALRVPFMEFSALREQDAQGLLGQLLAGGRPPPTWESGEAAAAAAAATAAAVEAPAVDGRGLSFPAPAGAKTAAPGAGAAPADGRAAACATIAAVEAAIREKMQQNLDHLKDMSPKANRTEAPAQAQPQAVDWRSDPMGLHSTETGLRGGPTSLPVSSPVGVDASPERPAEDNLAGSVAGSIANSTGRRSPGAPERQQQFHRNVREVGSSPPRPKEPRASEPLPKRQMARRSMGSLGEEPPSKDLRDLEVTAPVRQTSPTGAKKDFDRLAHSAQALTMPRTSGAMPAHSSSPPAAPVPTDPGSPEAGLVSHLSASRPSHLSAALNQTAPIPQTADDFTNPDAAGAKDRLGGSCLLPSQHQHPAVEVATIQALLAKQQAPQQPQQPQHQPPMVSKALLSQSAVFPSRMGEPPGRSERPNVGQGPSTALVPGTAAGANAGALGPCATPTQSNPPGAPLQQFSPGPMPQSGGSCLFAPGPPPGNGGSCLFPPGGAPGGGASHLSPPGPPQQVPQGPLGPATGPAVAVNAQGSPTGALQGQMQMPPGAGVQAPTPSSGSVMFSVTPPGATPPGSATTLQPLAAVRAGPPMGGPLSRARSPEVHLHARAKSPEASLAHSQPVTGQAGPQQPRGLAGRIQSAGSPEALHRDSRGLPQRGPQDARALAAQSPTPVRYEGSAVMPTFCGGGRMLPGRTLQAGHQQASPMAARPAPSVARQRAPQQQPQQPAYGYHGAGAGGKALQPAAGGYPARA